MNTKTQVVVIATLIGLLLMANSWAAEISIPDTTVYGKTSIEVPVCIHVDSSDSQLTGCYLAYQVYVSGAKITSVEPGSSNSFNLGRWYNHGYKVEWWQQNLWGFPRPPYVKIGRDTLCTITITPQSTGTGTVTLKNCSWVAVRYDNGAWSYEMYLPVRGTVRFEQTPPPPLPQPRVSLLIPDTVVMGSVVTLPIYYHNKTATRVEVENWLLKPDLPTGLKITAATPGPKFKGPLVLGNNLVWHANPGPVVLDTAGVLCWVELKADSFKTYPFGVRFASMSVNYGGKFIEIFPVVDSDKVTFVSPKPDPGYFSDLDTVHTLQQGEIREMVAGRGTEELFFLNVYMKDCGEYGFLPKWDIYWRNPVNARVFKLWPGGFYPLHTLGFMTNTADSSLDAVFVRYFYPISGDTLEKRWERYDWGGKVYDGLPAGWQSGQMSVPRDSVIVGNRMLYLEGDSSGLTIAEVAGGDTLQVKSFASNGFFTWSHDNGPKVTIYYSTGKNINKVEYIVTPIRLPKPGTSDEPQETLGLGAPVSFVLHQNYPNPFNPTTTIQFGLPKSSHVTLMVYNILGEKVADLIDGNLEGGIHNVNFNGENLSSGIH